MLFDQGFVDCATLDRHDVEASLGEQELCRNAATAAVAIHYVARIRVELLDARAQHAEWNIDTAFEAVVLMLVFKTHVKPHGAIFDELFGLAAVDGGEQRRLDELDEIVFRQAREFAFRGHAHRRVAFRPGYQSFFAEGVAYPQLGKLDLAIVGAHAHDLTGAGLDRIIVITWLTLGDHRVAGGEADSFQCV